jgi:hypothetical protein
MPFPLAHPAAVLPLRRFCPRRLSFPGLLIGSIVPDVAYFVDDICPFPSALKHLLWHPATDYEHLKTDLQWSDFSHSLAGSLLLALPVGLLLLSVFHNIATELVAMLPTPYRDALRPSCHRPPPSIAVGSGSIMIGIWLHLIWDSFTHDNSWLAQNWAFLHRHVLSSCHGGAEMLTVLWLLSSVGGLLVLFVAWLRFAREHRLPLRICLQDNVGRYFFWAVLFSIPLAIAIPTTVHFTRAEASANDYLFIFHVFSEYYLVALGLCVIATGFALKQRTSGPGSGSD